MKKINPFFYLFLLMNLNLYAQEIQLLTVPSKISIRGLSPIDDHVFWASGTNGKVARSTNGGKTIQWLTVAGYEKRDFRDIAGIDSNTAIIMAVDAPAIILKTRNGGQTWNEVFKDTTKGMFLDAMDFKDGEGFVIGDPINGKIFMAFTTDYGENWKVSPITRDIPVADGEAFFAASGTNIKLWKDKFPVFVSGGKKSAIFFSSTATYVLPLLQGKETTGANSLAIAPGNSNEAIVVGGDFANDTASTGNCTLITLTPFHTVEPQTPPHGYRSCVEYITAKKLIACGTSGVDVSTDGGLNWQLISKESFHVCQKGKNGNTVFLAGGKGKIGKLIW
jgi:Photosynthesis system II assembly factor YCF48